MAEHRTYNLETGKLNPVASKKKKEAAVKLECEGVTLFDFLNDITSGKKGILDEFNEHKFDKFMTCRFLSMDPNLLPIVNDYLNPYQEILDKKRFYTLCLELIPKQRRFLKYMKATDEMKGKEKIIGYLSELYDISKRDAYQYYNLLSADAIEGIKRRFGDIDKK